MINRRDAIRRLAGAGTALAMPAFAQSGNRIVLGQSAAFSGPAAQLGIQMNKGARIYFDALNASGGVHGSVIELRTLDDGYEPERCKANTEKLIKDDVFALFGYVGTPTCLAALPLSTRRGCRSSARSPAPRRCAIRSARSSSTSARRTTTRPR
jgi:ABC-type branched-subunit amino acid transport system substrate-binding protein